MLDDYSDIDMSDPALTAFFKIAYISQRFTLNTLTVGVCRLAVDEFLEDQSNWTLGHNRSEIKNLLNLSNNKYLMRHIDQFFKYIGGRPLTETLLAQREIDKGNGSYSDKNAQRFSFCVNYMVDDQLSPVENFVYNSRYTTSTLDQLLDESDMILHRVINIMLCKDNSVTVYPMDMVHCTCRSIAIHLNNEEIVKIPMNINARHLYGEDIDMESRLSSVDIHSNHKLLSDILSDKYSHKECISHKLRQRLKGRLLETAIGL
jgi:hypothetical protein